MDLLGSECFRIYVFLMRVRETTLNVDGKKGKHMEYDQDPVTAFVYGWCILRREHLQPRGKFPKI